MRCVDVDEDARLPEEMRQGTKAYREISSGKR
jgi:hypothetical protein